MDVNFSSAAVVVAIMVMVAIMQDNRNDVVSNSFVIGTYGIACTKAKLLLIDVPPRHHPSSLMIGWSFV